MKPKANETVKAKSNRLTANKMNRKEAIKKWGYFTAATMVILLSTGKAAHASPLPNTAPSAPTRWTPGA